MHISEGVLSPPVLIAGGGLAAAGVAYALKKMDYDLHLNIIKHGFYPKGGARVEVHSAEADLKPLNIPEKGEVKSIKGVSIASTHLKDARVADRQAEKAKELLAKRRDYNGLEILEKHKKKADDLADTVCQIEAFFSFKKWPLTKEPIRLKIIKK